MAPVRLDYGPRFMLARAYLSVFSFMGGLLVTSQVWPRFFEGSNMSHLWAGLLMIPLFWVLVHCAVVAALYLFLWPLKIPGRFALTDQGVSLATRKENQMMRWSQIRRVEVDGETLDFSVGVDGNQEAQVGRAIVEGLAKLAAKDWTLSFVGEGATIKVQGSGFARPIRQAAPRIRAYLQSRGFDVSEL